MGSSRNRPAPGPPGGDRRHGPITVVADPDAAAAARLDPDPTPHYRGGGPGNAAVRFAARWKDSRRGGGAVNRVDCQRSSRTYQFSTPVGALGSGTGLLVWILTEMKMMAVGASCESRPEQLCVALVASASAPSVTKWSQRFDREGLDGLKDKPGRRGQADDSAGHCPAGGRGGGQGAARAATLEHPLAGSGRSASRLTAWRASGRAKGSAASSAHLQGFQGQEVRRVVLGCGRSLSGPTREVTGVVLRREDAMPGPGAHAAGPAVGPRPYQDADTRLHPARHRHVVRCAELPGGQADLPHRTTAHARGVAAASSSRSTARLPKPSTST